MSKRPYAVQLNNECDWPPCHRFASFDAAEAWARKQLRQHLTENVVPRAEIYLHEWLVADVRASGDNRIWTDLRNLEMPLL